MCGLSCHKIGRRQRYTSSPTRLSPETIPITSRLTSRNAAPDGTYTQIFSREEACGGYSPFVAGSTRVDADAYARAAAALAAPDMLALTTEDLDNSWGRLDTYFGRQPGEGIAKPTAHANVYSGDRYRAPPEERERVAALEHYDVALYDLIARSRAETT